MVPSGPRRGSNRRSSSKHYYSKYNKYFPAIIHTKEHVVHIAGTAGGLGSSSSNSSFDDALPAGVTVLRHSVNQSGKTMNADDSYLADL